MCSFSRRSHGNRLISEQYEGFSVGRLGPCVRCAHSLGVLMATG